MSDSNKTPMIDVSIRVYGIKKRCRKPDYHVFKVKEKIPDTYVDSPIGLDLSQYITEAKALANKEMKEVKAISLYSTHYNIVNDGSFTTMEMILFNNRNETLKVEL